VSRLEAIEDREIGRFGAKAVNLARMIRAGMPVPPGFCISAGAYRQHVGSAEIATRIRAAIVEGPMCDSLAEEIRGAYRSIGGGAVAVRSSATTEDLPGHSFAGLHDSFLDVADEAGCVERVKRCWASLWTERAFEYRERNGFDHRSAGMAVIVQRLVRAEASGVLFTGDPVTGRCDRLIIEAGPGLGERIVRGEAVPDRFVLSKKGLRLRERAIAEGRGRRPCLRSRDIRQLARLALRIERLFGCPQDIEWCVRGSEIAILQSRAITTLHRGAPRSDRARRGYWDAFGLNPGELTALGVDLRDEDLPDLGFHRGRVLLAVPALLSIFFGYTPRNGTRFTARLRRKSDRLRAVDPAALSDREVADLLWREIGGLRRIMPAFLHLPRILVALPALQAVCRRWLGDADGRLAHALLAATGGLESARAGLDVWRLAAKAHEDPEVERAILAGDDWPATRRGLAEVRGGEGFLSAWERFMERHGHHTRGEIELASPRWSETPDYVLGFVRSELGGGHMRDLDAEEAKRSRLCADLAAECRRRLGNPIKRLAFDYVLDQARRAAALRENLKSEAMRFWGFFRALALHIGDRLRRKGALDARDDVFFLKVEEILAALQRDDRASLRDAVALRRADYEKNSIVNPPPVVAGTFDPERPGETVAGSASRAGGAADVWTGVPVSPGRARGRARVILRSDTGQHVLAGEILVAPFTDPGWVPYFVPAAAIVMDQGGLLSHGSIIAREYGIPAVVNVGPATKAIRTGDIIEVDGDRGVVRVLR